MKTNNKPVREYVKVFLYNTELITNNKKNNSAKDSGLPPPGLSCVFHENKNKMSVKDFLLLENTLNNRIERKTKRSIDEMCTNAKFKCIFDVTRNSQPKIMGKMGG